MPQPTAAAAETMVERQIRRAKELDLALSELRGEIAANREFLRLMDKTRELSDAQGSWLDSFYPQKEKNEQRSKDEIENTRKVKEQGRAEAKAARDS